VRSLPRSAQTYVVALGLAAMGGALWAFSALARSPVALPYVALYAALICIADLFPIVFPYPGTAETTVSCALKAAAVLVFGPATAVAATLIGTLAAEILLRRVWFKALFNVSQMTLTFGVMGAYYQSLWDGTPSPLNSPVNLLGLLVAALCYFVLNTGMVSLVIALSEKMPVTYVWRATFRDVALHDLTVMPMGALIAVCWASNPWTIILLFLPLMVVRQAMLQASTLQRQTTDTLLELVDAIDQRDPSTFHHSHRVAEYSEKIAREMGVVMDAVVVIAMAARLHDLGKIGMSNDLLYKPSKFTAEEWEQFKRHSAIGAQMVSHFSLFRKGQSLILHHHERFDGRGYPAGLAGQDIPLGARIMTVADSYEAMTAERVYKKALTVEQATAELRRERGHQFDPEVVDAMLAILRQEYPEKSEGPAPIVGSSRPAIQQLPAGGGE
jgi:putative nucleotidyltransferase with HDIG domain